MDNSTKKATLLLEDGTVFHGSSTGLDGTTYGEICFNTGMTGYQEIFTDPSYFGQLMVMATSHIGNYGVHAEEIESGKIQIAGLITKNFSEVASRTGKSDSLYGYFEKEGKVAIKDIDTRALVRHIRDSGAMNAIISTEIHAIDELKEELKKCPNMEGLALAPVVSTKEAYEVGPADSEIRVAALDLGIKNNIIKCLTDRGARVKIFPYNTSTEEMMAWNPNGLFYSNGPGDPAASPEVVAEVSKGIASGLPVFGICLGHQMIALASGLSTYKMHNGHRGINHPVKNVGTGLGEITSQNHGFVVKMEDVEASDNVALTHIHLNDQTVAGIKRTDANCFSVQYHPEASPGPHDSRYLFDSFIENIKNN
ncbi:MAG: glutamine-hydrolyzing carbamoyl-phosphate synthase small subunit [Cryomorphaceae bacterium]|nr:glutamine-hydrolyzing carbamoyl-phosphate synthase small subunit [Cryomorphaceae bacterium]